jgi:hypothetical protein
MEQKSHGPSRRKNKKCLIAMVTWTIPLAYIVEKIQMIIVLQTHLTLQIPIPMLLVDCVTKNRLISTLERTKKKSYCHDNGMKYFTNIIICSSFYQRYCLILPSPSKLKHNFPHFISIKKVASLPYPSSSCKVSFLAVTFYSCFFF